MSILRIGKTARKNNGVLVKGVGKVRLYRVKYKNNKGETKYIDVKGKDITDSIKKFNKAKIGTYIDIEVKKDESN